MGGGSEQGGFTAAAGRNLGVSFLFFVSFFCYGLVCGQHVLPFNFFGMSFFYFGDWDEALASVVCSFCLSFLGHEVVRRGVSPEVTTLLWWGDGVASTQAVAEVGAMCVNEDE